MGRAFPASRERLVRVLEVVLGIAFKLAVIVVVVHLLDIATVEARFLSLAVFVLLGSALLATVQAGSSQRA